MIACARIVLCALPAMWLVVAINAKGAYTDDRITTIAVSGLDDQAQGRTLFGHAQVVREGDNVAISLSHHQGAVALEFTR